MASNKILTPIIAVQLFMTTSCMEDSKSKKNYCSNTKHNVFIYATNWSRVDTLTRVLIIIDDSTIINKLTPRNQTSSEKFEKEMRLCDGPHRIHVEFGRYSKDTILTIKNNISILSSMVYEEKYKADNGLGIVTLARDNQSHGAD